MKIPCQAVDSDEDRSGLVQYSVPADAPIAVGIYNGTLYTSRALDYEQQQVGSLGWQPIG